MKEEEKKWVIQNDIFDLFLAHSWLTVNFCHIPLVVLRIRYICTNIAKVMHVILHSSTSITPNQRSIWRFEASQSMYLTSGDERPLR